MKANICVFVCLMFFKFGSICAEMLFAASVHWRPMASNGTNQIILSYKLIWQQKVLPLCPIPNNGTLCYFYTDGSFSATVKTPRLLTVPRWQGYTWKCTNGCINTTTVSNLSSLFYTDVGTFHDVSWEAAMEMVVFTFGQNDDLANINIGFIDPKGRLVPGLGGGMFDMAVRNDTGRANISPAITPLPYYRVPLGCNITISLFPFDGDGDYVRCYWQRRPARGTNLSSVVLNQEMCELRVHADPTRGFSGGHGVTISLFAEDFAKNQVKLSRYSEDITSGPFSRTPVLLYLYVSPVTANCNPGPTFIETGTLPPNSVQSYPLPLINAKLPFKIPTNHGQMILTSGPRYMSFRHNNASDTIEGTWAYINDTSMTGIHQACGMAYTKNGVPGETRCAVFLLHPNWTHPCVCPMKNGQHGLCKTLFEYFVCDYTTANHTSPRSSTKPTSTTTFYSRKQWPSSVHATGRPLKFHTGNPSASTSSQTLTMCRSVCRLDESNNVRAMHVLLPIGLSCLLMVVIIVTAVYLRRRWANRAGRSSINPENQQDGIIAASENVNGI